MSTRPATLHDVAAIERHRDLAQTITPAPEALRLTRTIVVATAIAIVALWTLTGAALIAVLVGTALTIAVTQTRDRISREHTLDQVALAIAFLEGLRGKPMTKTVTACFSGQPDRLITAAEAAEQLIGEVGIARVHQLVVRSDQIRDFGLLVRLAGSPDQAKAVIDDVINHRRDLSAV